MEIEYDYIHLRHGYGGDVKISSTKKNNKKTKTKKTPFFHEQHEGKQYFPLETQLC